MNRLRAPAAQAMATCAGLTLLLAVGSRSAAASPVSTAPSSLAFERGEFLRPELRLTGIYRVNAAGGGRRQLVKDRRGLGDFAWSPDGRRLAFARSSGGLFVVHAGGSGQRRLTADPHVGRLAWSPNGSRIAFTSKRKGVWKIYVVRSAGGRARLLAAEPKTHDFVSWSPNGRQIAFFRGRFACGDFGCPLNLYVLDTASGAVKLLTRRAEGFGLSWSPDGRRIAFSGRAGENDDDLYVVKADGSHKRDLTSGVIDSLGEAVSDFDPAWAPDGKRIAFTRSLYNKGLTGVVEIYSINPDGSHLRRLTPHESRFPPSDGDPTWSPNGSRIAFERVTFSGHESQVFVMNPDGSRARDVAPSKAWDEHPLWRPHRH